MSTATTTAKTHKSRSGQIDITMKFQRLIGQWSVHATRTSGEEFGSRFFLTEDEAKVYANHLWTTDGVTAPAPVQTDLVSLAAEFESAPAAAPARQDWFAATGQSTVRSASPKQIKLVADLLVERDVPATGGPYGKGLELARTGLNASNASPIIDWLFTLPKKASAQSTTAAPKVDIPAGHYATPSRTGNNDLDFWTVDRPTQGRWEGYTFVSRVIGGHEDQRVRGAEARAALEAIAAEGPEQAARRYGQEIGRCGRCNRHLTDETSRSYGLGPECRSKGW